VRRYYTSSPPKRFHGVLRDSFTFFQRGTTGGQRATSGPRPLAIKPMKLFVNLLLVTMRSFILFVSNNRKKSRLLTRLLFYVQVPHMLLL
jgi:hypothetical protein